MKLTLPIPTFNVFFDLFGDDGLSRSYHFRNIFAIPSAGDFVSFADGNCGYVVGRPRWQFDAKSDVYTVQLMVREKLEE